eukprot:8627577-Pyramimonas_sp.AAC.1
MNVAMRNQNSVGAHNANIQRAPLDKIKDFDPRPVALSICDIKIWQEGDDPASSRPRERHERLEGSDRKVDA